MLQYKLAVLIMLLSFNACKESNKQVQLTTETQSYIDEIDSMIRSTDPYVRQDAYRRFNTFNFKLDSTLNLDTAFPYTMILANYDTLTRELTSIGILYFKDKPGTYGQTDQASYDTSGNLVRILTINDEIHNNQRQASYYFRNDSLVYQDTLHLKKDLDTYLGKMDSIRKFVIKTLVEEDIIDEDE